ncbi:MAG TPA: hypothetical protein VEF04_13285, partial [Blastocatellia bacterium]|nr:hypothetical protein [Blastocatellia bacterium]
IPLDQFDPVSHGSLAPIAFHYFSPGVLLYVIEYCAALYSFEWGCWAEQFVPLKRSVDRFQKEYLPFFSLPQRDAVASCLRYANQQYFNQNSYYKEDWEKAVKEIWRKHAIT